jgi:hypothetical protein
MWQHRFQAFSHLPGEVIWPHLANVSAWPQIDHNIDWLKIDGEPAAGQAFRLKPKGGPVLSFTIGKFEAPGIYSDICQMPLASMETVHRLTPDPSGTLIEVEIAIRGPLAWLWGVLVGRKHAQGLPAQTERLLAFAGTGRG